MTLKSEGDIKWSDGGVKELKFEVYSKQNQRLKYLNTNSTYKKMVFHAIPKGLFHLLPSLTSFDEGNNNNTVSELYSKHTEALCIVGLV